MNSSQLSNSRLISQLKAVAKAASVIGILVGCLVIMGWIFEISAFKSIIPGWAAIKANTALCFLFSGIALRLHQQAEMLRHNVSRIGQCCAFVVMAIALLTLAQYIFNWNFGIDQLLFQDTSGIFYPGRIAPNSALNFFLLSGILVLVHNTRHRYKLIQLLTLIPALVAGLALIGYAYEVESLYKFSDNTSMSLFTAITFIILCLGILFIQPDQGLMKIITSNTMGGFIARRLLVAAIAIPFVLGLLIHYGQKYGLYTPTFAISLLVTANISIFVIVIWQNAQRIDCLEQRRQQVEDELQETLATLQALFQASPLGIISWDIEANLKLWSPAAESIFGWTEEEKLGQRVSFIPEDKVAEFSRLHQLTLQGNVLKGIELQRQKKDGSLIDIAIWAAPLSDNKGHNSTMAVIADISERKRTQEALKSSEERFRQLAENIQNVFWMADLKQQQLLYVSPAYKQIWGRSCDLLRNVQGWLETIHPDERDLLQDSFSAGLSRGSLEELPWEEFDRRYRIVRPDGTVRWIRDSEALLRSRSVSQRSADRGFPIKNEFGEVLHIAGIAEDITERKQAESTLQASEERFRKFFEEAPIGISVVELDGRFLKVNKNYCEMLGYQEEELHQMMFADITYPEDNDLDIKYTQQLFNGEIPSYQVEKRYIKKTGEILWVNLTATMIYEQEGNAHYGLAMVEDITERKRTQEALQEITQTLQALIQACPLGITVFSLDDGKVKLWNQAAETIFGWSEQEVLGHFLPTVPEHKQAEFLANLSVVRQGKELPGREARRQKKGGLPIDINVWAAPLVDAKGNATCLSIVADITERKRLEEERNRLLESEQAARSAAEAANRIKDEFLAVLSHELRTPMNAILGWTHLLRTRKFEQAATIKALEVIDRNSKLLSQLIEDVLDVSKVVSGKLQLSIHPVELVGVIEAAIETVYPTAQLKEIHIESLLDHSIGLVLADGNRLQQVIWNLLSNAVKFTPKGGRIEVQLSFFTGNLLAVNSTVGLSLGAEIDLPQAVEQYVQIQVKDTGKGIAPEFLPHVFERFRQENSSTTRTYGGLGLGLAIVRHLVELHGGMVWAESLGEGKGATFWVVLPFVSPLTDVNGQSVIKI